jgi:hypothetical protein
MIGETVRGTGTGLLRSVFQVTGSWADSPGIAFAANARSLAERPGNGSGLIPILVTGKTPGVSERSENAWYDVTASLGESYAWFVSASASIQDGLCGSGQEARPAEEGSRQDREPPGG